MDTPPLPVEKDGRAERTEPVPVERRWGPAVANRWTLGELMLLEMSALEPLHAARVRLALRPNLAYAVARRRLLPRRRLRGRVSRVVVGVRHALNQCPRTLEAVSGHQVQRKSNATVGAFVRSCPTGG